MATNAPLITNSTVTIRVEDLDRSVKFYVEGLGLKLIGRYGDHYAQVSSAGLVIGLHPSKKSTPSEGFSIGFGIDHLAEAKLRLTELAVAHNDRNEQGGKFIHFKDPDGYDLYFRENS